LSKHIYLLGVIVIIAVDYQPVRAQQSIDARIIALHKELDKITHEFNTVRNIAIDSNTQAVSAFKTVQELLKLLKEGVEPGVAKAQAATAQLGQEYDKWVRALKDEVALQKKTIEAVLKQHALTPDDIIKIDHASVASGDYAQKVKAEAEATIGIHREKIKSIKEFLGDPLFIIKIAAAIAIVVLCIYVIKYGVPALMNYLSRPHVISEVSRSGWFGWGKTQPDVSSNNLIFAPVLHDQLHDLMVRVQTAKKYNETLPNVLLYGAPGTGKTAFVKALAYSSGLDYALTSGSEFAKITDLNQANEELRKLLTWAPKTSKGLIVFIDEAESLFVNRKLPTASQHAQDFINTFLSLVHDQSQKNLMFILATNHPFKLDDAVINRMAKSIEFTLPEVFEREKILVLYLAQGAQENKDALVTFTPEFKHMLPHYAELLKGFSPRAIKGVAEEMIIQARRQKFMQLTDEIAQSVIKIAQNSLQQALVWEAERDKWTQATALAVRSPQTATSKGM
jgi:hypothetical protein